MHYEQKPEINCCYHNTNDPRVCVCATDRAQCGKSVCVANLGTTGGKCICVSVVLLCVLFPIVFQVLLPLFDDDETTRCCIDKHSDCMRHSSYGEQDPRQICSGDSEHTYSVVVTCSEFKYHPSAAITADSDGQAPRAGALYRCCVSTSSCRPGQFCANVLANETVH